MRTPFVLICFLFACNGPEKNCSVTFQDLNGSKYIAEGCLTDSLEDGSWHIYNNKKNLIEWGTFHSGIRIGQWHYRDPDSSEQIISWRRYSDSNLKLLTNVPDFLDIIESGPNYVKFSSSKDNHITNAVIAFRNLDQMDLNIDTFYRENEKEIEAKGWEYEYSRQKIISNNQKYYFTHYLIKPKNRETITILNFYGKSNRQQLVDISFRFNISEDREAKLIFGSMLPNIFLDSGRFINPFADIATDQRQDTKTY